MAILITLLITGELDTYHYMGETKSRCTYSVTEETCLSCIFDAQEQKL
jgi:hypothetical protein